MRKISEQNRRHLDKLARKGQNRWKPPRSKTAKTAALKSIPAELLEGLTTKDQEAIQAIVGQSVKLVGVGHGKAQLEFVDAEGDNHSIWVEPSYLRIERQSKNELNF